MVECWPKMRITSLVRLVFLLLYFAIEQLAHAGSTDGVATVEPDAISSPGKLTTGREEAAGHTPTRNDVPGIELFTNGYDIFSFRIPQKYFTYTYDDLDYTARLQGLFLALLEKKIQFKADDPCETEYGVGIQPVTIPKSKYTPTRTIASSESSTYSKSDERNGLSDKEDGSSRLRQSRTGSAGRHADILRSRCNNECTFWSQWSLWWPGSSKSGLECSYRNRDCIIQDLEMSYLSRCSETGKACLPINTCMYGLNPVYILGPKYQGWMEREVDWKLDGQNVDEPIIGRVQHEDNTTEGHRVCTFNEGFCGWSNARVDQWVISSLSHSPNQQENSQGHYARVQGNGSQVFKPFRLEHELNSSAGDRACLTFRYYMTSHYTETSLSVLVRQSCNHEEPGVMTQHLRAAGIHGWQTNAVEFPVNECSKVTILAYLAKTTDEIGIDDVILMDGECRHGST